MLTDIHALADHFLIALPNINMFFRHPSTVEDQSYLCVPKDNTLVANELNTRMTQLQDYRKKNKSLTRAYRDCPHFLLLGHRGLGLF